MITSTLVVASADTTDPIAPTTSTQPAATTTTFEFLPMPDFEVRVDELFNDILPKILLGVGIVFAIMFAIWFLLSPFWKGTGGLMPEGYVGVVYRFSSFVRKKTICPIDASGRRIDRNRRLPWILDRVYWRYPFWTKVLQANVQWTKVTSDQATLTSAVVGGVPIDLEVIADVQVFDPTGVGKEFDVRSSRDNQAKSMQAIFDDAVRTLRDAIIRTSVTTVLSQFEDLTYPKLKLMTPELLDEISRRTDEIAIQHGFRVRDVRFEKINPQESVAQGMAATVLVKPATEAAIMHAESILGDGGELDLIEAGLRRRYPEWLDEQIRALAMDILVVIAARQSGRGVDVTTPAGGRN